MTLNGGHVVNKETHNLEVVIKNFVRGAVVVAQLVERLLPIPEVCGSNPVIGKNLFIH